MDKIRALDPDMVIGFSDIQADLARKLIAANLPVLIFNQRSVQEILDVIIDVGSLVHKREQAVLLVEQYIDRLEGIMRRTASYESKPKVYFEEWDEPMICGIRWVSEFIEIAGGKDVFADRACGPGARERQVTVEDVVREGPDVMLASWCGKPFDEQAVHRRPGMSKVPAVANQRIYEVPAEIILQPRPACLSDGVEFLEALFKPKAIATSASG